jgi:hypothetical protein
MCQTGLKDALPSDVSVSNMLVASYGLDERVSDQGWPLMKVFAAPGHQSGFRNTI